MAENLDLSIFLVGKASIAEIWSEKNASPPWEG